MSEAEQARDAGIEQVLANNKNWKERVFDYALTLKGWSGTGEDLRLLITQVVGTPFHHNAWGGAIAGLVKKGILHKTGEYRKMVTKASHARATPVYSTESAVSGSVTKRQALEVVDKWMRPEFMDMIDTSMTDREIQMLRKVIANISIGIRSLPA